MHSRRISPFLGRNGRACSALDMARFSGLPDPSLSVTHMADAPLYPTSARALEGLQDIISNPDHILDAGCGLGHGLRNCAVSIRRHD